MLGYVTVTQYRRISCMVKYAPLHIFPNFQIPWDTIIQGIHSSHLEIDPNLIVDLGFVGVSSVGSRSEYFD